MPETYSILFERRVAQLAKVDGIDPVEAMTAVIDKAVALAETGEIASGHLPIWGVDDVDEDEDADVAVPPATVEAAVPHTDEVAA